MLVEAGLDAKLPPAFKGFLRDHGRGERQANGYKRRKFVHERASTAIKKGWPKDVH